MGGIFSTRALLNATMVASLVTLLFMSLLNFQGEQQLNQLAADLRENNTRLDQNESRIDMLNEANAALSISNTDLIKQNSDFISTQASLTKENTELALENKRIQNARSKLLSEFTNVEEESKEVAIERATMAEEIARLQNQIEANDERVALIGTATAALLLVGTAEAPAIQGTFFQNDRKGALVLYGLAPLADDEIYQVWLVTPEGEQVSAGLFAVAEDDGATWAEVLLPQSVPEYELIRVSIEPSGGSDEPTGPMQLESVPLSTATPDAVG